MKYFNYMHTPIGEIEIKHELEFIYEIHFGKENSTKIGEQKKVTALIKETRKQLKNYFAGELKSFNLPLKLEGTEFQIKVWHELCKIPFAKTISYLQLAKQLGDEKCIRAAASANGKNPFAIIIPCHRVIGTNGNLTGYAGGLWRKHWLLEHEAKVCGTFNKLF